MQLCELIELKRVIVFVVPNEAFLATLPYPNTFDAEWLLYTIQ